MTENKFEKKFKFATNYALFLKLFTLLTLCKLFTNF